MLALLGDTAFYGDRLGGARLLVLLGIAALLDRVAPLDQALARRLAGGGVGTTGTTRRGLAHGGPGGLVDLLLIALLDRLAALLDALLRRGLLRIGRGGRRGLRLALLYLIAQCLLAARLLGLGGALGRGLVLTGLLRFLPGLLGALLLLLLALRGLAGLDRRGLPGWLLLGFARLLLLLLALLLGLQAALALLRRLVGIGLGEFDGRCLRLAGGRRRVTISG
ncbi:MAG: hypothetical protein NW205_00400 [Hyphomicrobiaceae bacterium]|nr:hypothetical protein [Hyphomicrobiaceae bacterium]